MQYLGNYWSDFAQILTQGQLLNGDHFAPLFVNQPYFYFDGQVYHLVKFFRKSDVLWTSSLLSYEEFIIFHII